jgi:hypothetical protein
MSKQKEKEEQVELEKFGSPFGHPQQAQEVKEEGDKKQKAKKQHDKSS